MPRESGASSNHRPADGKRLCLTRSCVVTKSPGQGRATTILGSKRWNTALAGRPRFQAGELNARGRRQSKLPGRAARPPVNMKVRRAVVDRAHAGRGGGDDLHAPTPADPVDVTVAMHDDGAGR